VGIRAGLETRSLDANANFAYELLTSINKYSERRATTKMQTPTLRDVKHPGTAGLRQSRRAGSLAL